VLFILFLIAVNAAKFGSVHSKKLDKIKLVHQVIDAWNNVDTDVLRSLVAEDFVGILQQETYDKEKYVQRVMSLTSALQFMNINIDNCKIGKEGEVICSWEGHGKFVKEFMGFQPHNKYIHYGGVNEMHFNDQGLMTKSLTYYRMAEFVAQLQGKTTQREETLQVHWDWWNGKLPFSYASHIHSEKFSVLSPFKKFNSFSEWSEFIEFHRQSSSQMYVDAKCDPSAEDFDVWICNFHCIQNVERDNHFGLKNGAKIDIDGVSIFKFDEQGKIEGMENYFDAQDYMKQGSTV